MLRARLPRVPCTPHVGRASQARVFHAPPARGPALCRQVKGKDVGPCPVKLDVLVCLQGEPGLDGRKPARVALTLVPARPRVAAARQAAQRGLRDVGVADLGVVARHALAGFAVGLGALGRVVAHAVSLRRRARTQGMPPGRALLHACHGAVGAVDLAGARQAEVGVAQRLFAVGRRLEQPLRGIVPRLQRQAAALLRVRARHGDRGVARATDTRVGVVVVHGRLGRPAAEAAQVKQVHKQVAIAGLL